MTVFLIEQRGTHPLIRRKQTWLASVAIPFWCVAILLVIVPGFGATTLFAQTKVSARPRRLPTADKIVERYLKAIGGRKRIAAVRATSAEYALQLNDKPAGTATILSKAPGSLRSEMTFADGAVISGASPSSAWSRGRDGQLRTLTGREGGAAKLQALLQASNLVDYKKLTVAARVLALNDSDGDAAFTVEFSTRSGAKTLYYFSSSTGLVIRIEDEARSINTRLSDYRPENGLLQPHNLRVEVPGLGSLNLSLQRIVYNNTIAASVFDPPAATEVLDVVALWRQVNSNQEQVEKRVSEYSFMQKETDREINSKGVVKKETFKVSEVFPIANREPITKLISENGVTLAGERAAKEAKRVQEEFLKAERDRDKDAQKAQQRRAERQRKNAAKAGGDEDDDVEISEFLKVCEFVAPRRERFRDRDAVVFDFRARAGFRPGNRKEDLISKLVGVVWIDPADKQVMRLEARLSEGFKMAGGLLFSLRPGAAFVMEQTRMDEGVWLPLLAQINLSMKVLLFGGGDMNKTIEWSDYKHFKGDVKEYQLEAPKTEAKP
jgi:hypothetical protein